MDSVFVFFREQVYDYDILSQDLQVFDTKEKAKKAFDEFVNDEKEWLSEHEKDWVIDENSMNFDAYNEGSYAQYHTTAFWGNYKVQ